MIKDKKPFFCKSMQSLLPDLRIYAYNLCKNDIQADDLVQQACMKAWEARDTFKPGANFRKWLFRILRNEYFQILRRSWRNVEYCPVKHELLLAYDNPCESTSDLRSVMAVLKELPRAQYEAIILVMLGGFTYEEAGYILECSAGTLKSRVSRGRERAMTQLNTVSLKPAQKAAANDIKTSVLAEISAIIEAILQAAGYTLKADLPRLSNQLA